jgi:hypothetical protein
MMSRNQFLVVGGVGLSVIAGFVIAKANGLLFKEPDPPPVVDILSAEGVIEMRAGMRESQIGFLEIPEFIVPAEHVTSILSWLRPGEYVPRPPIFSHDELGTIRIKTKTGRDVTLRFYWAGHNPAVYTVDGTNYFWGNTVEADPGVDGGIRLGKAVQAAFNTSKR